MNRLVSFALVLVGLLVAVEYRRVEALWLRFVIWRRVREKMKWDLLPFECSEGHRSRLGGFCHVTVGRETGLVGYTKCNKPMKLRAGYVEPEEREGPGCVGS